MTDEANITPAEAKSMLSGDAPQIHTFRNPGANVLIGADWDRYDILKAINEAKVLKLTGPMAQGMKHGLAVWNADGWLYVQTISDEPVY